MAAPKRNRSSPEDPSYEKTREKIKTGQLITRLLNHALGKNKMTTTQVTAGLGLLRKALPDLSNVEMKVGPSTEQPWIGPKPLTETDWQAKHGEETEH